MSSEYTQIVVTSFDGLSERVSYVADRRLYVSAAGAIQASCDVVAAFAHLFVPDGSGCDGLSAAGAAAPQHRGGWYGTTPCGEITQPTQRHAEGQQRQPFGDSFAFGNTKGKDAATLLKEACTPAPAAPVKERGVLGSLGEAMFGPAKQPAGVARCSLIDQKRRALIETAICAAWSPHAAVLTAAATAESQMSSTTFANLILEFSEATEKSTVGDIKMCVPMTLVPPCAVSDHNPTAVAQTLAAQIQEGLAPGPGPFESGMLRQASLLGHAAFAGSIDGVDDAGAFAAVMQKLLEVSAEHRGFCPTKVTAKVEIAAKP